MEVVVALLLLGGCAIVIYDSIRIGFGWQRGRGPAPGYFPFWIAVILGVSSLINLVNAARGDGRGEIFVSLRPFGRVLAVLIPSLVYVALVGGIKLGPVDVPGSASTWRRRSSFRLHDRHRTREPLKALGVSGAGCRWRCS